MKNFIRKTGCFSLLVFFITAQLTPLAWADQLSNPTETVSPEQAIPVINDKDPALKTEAVDENLPQKTSIDFLTGETLTKVTQEQDANSSAVKKVIQPEEIYHTIYHDSTVPFTVSFQVHDDNDFRNFSFQGTADLSKNSGDLLDADGKIIGAYEFFPYPDGNKSIFRISYFDDPPTAHRYTFHFVVNNDRSQYDYIGFLSDGSYRPYIFTQTRDDDAYRGFAEDPLSLTEDQQRLLSSRIIGDFGRLYAEHVIDALEAHPGYEPPQGQNLFILYQNMLEKQFGGSEREAVVKRVQAAWPKLSLNVKQGMLSIFQLGNENVVNILAKLQIAFHDEITQSSLSERQKINYLSRQFRDGGIQKLIAYPSLSPELRKKLIEQAVESLKIFKDSEDIVIFPILSLPFIQETFEKNLAIYDNDPNFKLWKQEIIDWTVIRALSDHTLDLYAAGDSASGETVAGFLFGHFSASLSSAQKNLLETEISALFTAKPKDSGIFAMAIQSYPYLGDAKLKQLIETSLASVDLSAATPLDLAKTYTTLFSPPHFKTFSETIQSGLVQKTVQELITRFASRSSDDSWTYGFDQMLYTLIACLKETHSQDLYGFYLTPVLQLLNPKQPGESGEAYQTRFNRVTQLWQKGIFLYDLSGGTFVTPDYLKGLLDFADLNPDWARVVVLNTSQDLGQGSGEAKAGVVQLNWKKRYTTPFLLVEGMLHEGMHALELRSGSEVTRLQATYRQWYYNYSTRDLNQDSVSEYGLLRPTEYIAEFSEAWLKDSKTWLQKALESYAQGHKAMLNTFLAIANQLDGASGNLSLWQLNADGSRSREPIPASWISGDAKNGIYQIILDQTVYQFSYRNLSVEKVETFPALQILEKSRFGSGELMIEKKFDQNLGMRYFSVFQSVDVKGVTTVHERIEIQSNYQITNIPPGSPASGSGDRTLLKQISLWTLDGKQRTLYEYKNSDYDFLDVQANTNSGLHTTEYFYMVNVQGKPVLRKGSESFIEYSRDSNGRVLSLFQQQTNFTFDSTGTLTQKNITLRYNKDIYSDKSTEQVNRLVISYNSNQTIRNVSVTIYKPKTQKEEYQQVYEGTLNNVQWGWEAIDPANPSGLSRLKNFSGKTADGFNLQGVVSKNSGVLMTFTQIAAPFGAAQLRYQRVLDATGKETRFLIIQQGEITLASFEVKTYTLTGGGIVSVLTADDKSWVFYPAGTYSLREKFPSATFGNIEKISSGKWHTSSRKLLEYSAQWAVTEGGVTPPTTFVPQRITRTYSAAGVLISETTTVQRKNQPPLVLIRNIFGGGRENFILSPGPGIAPISTPNLQLMREPSGLLTYLSAAKPGFPRGILEILISKDRISIQG